MKTNAYFYFLQRSMCVSFNCIKKLLFLQKLNYTMAQLTLSEFWLTCPTQASNALSTQSDPVN